MSPPGVLDIDIYSFLFLKHLHLQNQTSAFKKIDFN